MHNTQSILLLAPQLYGAPGGIQAYMRRLWEIVSDYGKNRGCPVQCLSSVDSREEGGRHPRPVEHDGFLGCQGNKLSFVIRAIGHATTYPGSLMIVGHIRQVPVAGVLKQLGLIRSYILVLYGIEAWKRLKWLKQDAARRAECIVSISSYTALEFCKQNGIALDRLRLIPPALAEDEISQFTHVPRNTNSELRVLTVGRLSVGDRSKGVDTLIEAIGEARNSGAKIVLTVAGDGDDLPRLKEMAARLKLDGQVIFSGAVPSDRLRALYEECDVFAMPSKKEGFGIVFLEAMYHGKPCIGGNYGGIPEVIDHGVDGYLVDYGNVGPLTRYLVEFSRNSLLRRDMGLKAWEKVKSRYLFPRMADNWGTLLDELLGR